MNCAGKRKLYILITYSAVIKGEVLVRAIGAAQRGHSAAPQQGGWYGTNG